MSRKLSKDVVLCRTTNRYIAKKATLSLTNASISYNTKVSHIPFFMRAFYDGAPTVYSIKVHENYYSKARRAMLLLGRDDYEKLSVNIL